MPPIEQSLVDDGLCTVAEAAEFLGISRGKLYQLMQQGELPYCKLGKNRRVPRAAVKALDANKTTLRRLNRWTRTQQDNRTPNQTNRCPVVCWVREPGFCSCSSI